MDAEVTTLQAKRTALQALLAQAEQQAEYWRARREQLRGALMLLDELDPPSPKADPPP